MKVITHSKSRDYTRAASALVSCMLEREIDVVETKSSKTWQYDFYDSNGRLDLEPEEESRILEQLGLLVGVETFITFSDKYSPSGIKGERRHPNYPLWYTTEHIQLQPIEFDSHAPKPGTESRNCSKLSSSRFVARTQMTVAMLICGIDVDEVRAIGFEYSDVPLVVCKCIDPTDIHLVETRGYQEALELRQQLSSRGIASMIHPSGERPVVAYISNIPDFKAPKKSRVRTRVKDLSNIEIGLVDGDGLIAIDANFDEN